ncbi:putative peroxiredoxin pmp20 [Grifola frondosa]|uniref:Putative peroxiredoxin pmp20 n=1 Tax=Grifola frondosa TaxID=5627 RepID=A0A1C7M9Y5_GRIFR|nr:putative peroxiredoxin pmp20 [Grifola frondosa]
MSVASLSPSCSTPSLRNDLSPRLCDPGCSLHCYHSSQRSRSEAWLYYTHHGAGKGRQPEKTITFEGITGKNIFVGVPGAFTGTCSAQVPGFIKAYEKFKEKGVNNIYVVGVNDVFVMKAWKEQLASAGTPVHFIADDKGAFIGAMGLLFDASPLLGAPRSKRFVVITEGPTVKHVVVEPNPGELTICAADKVLPLL